MMKSLAEARIKRVRAFELMAEGKSYDEIARLVGYRHRGSAHRAVFRALAEQEVANVDELRTIERDRLDSIQVSLWPQAMPGDVRAVNAILRIIDYRIQLLGLADRHTTDGVEGPRRHHRLGGHPFAQPSLRLLDPLARCWSRCLTPRTARLTR